MSKIQTYKEFLNYFEKWLPLIFFATTSHAITIKTSSNFLHK